jgi:hypothetical protein
MQDLPEEEQVKIRAKQDALRNSTFRQNNMPAWRPGTSFFAQILTFFIFGGIFLLLGAILFFKTNSIDEVTFRYDIDCPAPTSPVHGSDNTVCTTTFEIDDTMEQPIYMYYQLENFYQNHRRYIKSKSVEQLGGEDLGVADLDVCEPIITNRDLGFDYAADGKTKLDPEAPANPCGLVAMSLFNDTYTLKDPKGAAVEVKFDDIAWDSDKKNKFDDLEEDWASK